MLDIINYFFIIRFLLKVFFHGYFLTKVTSHDDVGVETCSELIGPWCPPGSRCSPSRSRPPPLPSPHAQQLAACTWTTKIIQIEFNMFLNLKKNSQFVYMFVFKIHCLVFVFCLTRHTSSLASHTAPIPSLVEVSLPQQMLGRPPDDLLHQVHLVQHLASLGSTEIAPRLLPRPVILFPCLAVGRQVVPIDSLPEDKNERIELDAMLGWLVFDLRRSFPVKLAGSSN